MEFTAAAESERVPGSTIIDNSAGRVDAQWSFTSTVQSLAVR
jgi:hypothetical protein